MPRGVLEDEEYMPIDTVSDNAFNLVTLLMAVSSVKAARPKYAVGCTRGCVGLLGCKPR